VSRSGLGLTLLAAAVLLSACQRHEPPPPAAQIVVAQPVHADGVTAAASLPGTVEAHDSTPLSFRVAGKLIERKVRLGDTVKEGQVLALLDPADFRKNASSAQAALDASVHNLAFAQAQLARDKAQSAAGLIAANQLEQTENAYAAAVSQHDQAAQQAALSNDQLHYATLVADHAGAITAENADTGQNVAAGQAVYQLAWSGALDVVSDVPETLLSQLKPGSAASVSLPAAPGRTYEAQVREIAPAADPQSRTYRVKLTLEHPDAAVRLGMTANVAFAAPSASAGGDTTHFTLPATALFHQGDAPAVWVVDARDVLVLRPVTVTHYGDATVTVSSGLQDGERVVLQGVHAVSAGEKVQITPPLHPADDPEGSAS
jgi:membrane fusion protein, multidrug efflux system